LLFIKWFNLPSFANKTHEIKLNQGAAQKHTESNKKSTKFNEEIPRKMIPEAAFFEFPEKISGNSPFLAETRRKMPGIRRRNPTTISGCRF
jgi:hypothetical protein